MFFLDGGINRLFEQFIRLIQIIGIPLMGVLTIVGLLILLTSGKNPRRKRIGMVSSIVFSIGLFVVSYVPLLTYLAGDSPKQAQGNETIESFVNSTTGFGGILFEALSYITYPVVFTTFYIGIFVLLLAVKSPQRKRLGWGLMIFSPIILGVFQVLPYLIRLL